MYVNSHWVKANTDVDLSNLCNIANTFWKFSVHGNLAICVAVIGAANLENLCTKINYPANPWDSSSFHIMQDSQCFKCLISQIICPTNATRSLDRWYLVAFNWRLEPAKHERKAIKLSRSPLKVLPENKIWSICIIVQQTVIPVYTWLVSLSRMANLLHNQIAWL
jgi:hypothetical protein